MDVYQLKIALRGISPMVWRRLKVAGNTDLADLHTIFQLAMGWKDYHLHAYRIYANDYGAYKPGGMLFADDPKKVLLSDFHFRTGDRFEHAYDFTAGWVHDIRIAAVESKDTEAFDPVPIESKYSKIAFGLYRAYLDRLRQTGDEDFDGLLQQAASEVERGITKFQQKGAEGDLRDIRYIFVDEYQDFSELFFKLINAVRQKNPDVEFFVVGDDWQAINGFAGSDLKFYNSFDKYFVSSEKLYITTNYRSARRVVELGNLLMEGLGKPAIPHKGYRGNAILVDLSEFEPSLREKEIHAGDEITPVALRLISKSLGERNSVALLARKNNLPWYVNQDASKRGSPASLEGYQEFLRSFFSEELRLRISVSTVHKYKGLESDAVILLDAVDRSFPLVHPRWIFTRVLGDSLEKIIAEERRLFYVALTRAARSLFVITESDSVSSFLQDIMWSEEFEEIDWDDFPPIKDTSGRLTVSVSNLDKFDGGATFRIKDTLKACSYRWNVKDKQWQKSYPGENFSVDVLRGEAWADTASGVIVTVGEGREPGAEAYAVNSGRWVRIKA